MTHPLPRVRRATHVDAVGIADTIAEAFNSLPAACWLVADPGQRYRSMAGQFRIVVEHALVHGSVDMLEDRSAAAVWFHYDGDPVPEPPDYDRRLAEVCGGHVDRFRALDELFAAHHPHEPHHHLAMLAVRPHAQATGRGTALLEHHHAHLDARGITAYLEASSESNRHLYARRGYRPGTPFHLPDGPPFWPMWRAPHPSGGLGETAEVAGRAAG